MPLPRDGLPRVTLTAGKSGSGKTTFAFRYLVNADFSARFLFGLKPGDVARLGLAEAETEEELLYALEDGWCIFSPRRMFPGRHAEAFEWFASWAYAVAGTLPGRSAILLDEVWKFCSPHSIPSPLSVLLQEGRHAGIETVLATQRPNRINGAVHNELTELVTFRVQGGAELAALQQHGINVDEISRLAPGQFVAVNIDTGGELRGKVF